MSIENSLESIKPYLPINPSREQIEAAMRVLKVRRDIMERFCAANEYRAHIMRYEANILECENKIAQMNLEPWQKKDITGRIAEAEAAIESAEQQIYQGELEVQVLQMALCP